MRDNSKLEQIYEESYGNASGITRNPKIPLKQRVNTHINDIHSMWTWELKNAKNSWDKLERIGALRDCLKSMVMAGIIKDFSSDGIVYHET